MLKSKLSGDIRGLAARFFGLLLIALGAGLPVESRAADSVERERGPVDFNRDVRPILSDHCYACHGPDANKREAGLRLDEQASAHESAIVPGDVEASELVARIDSTDEFDVMPPPELHKPLSAEQKAILKQWIAEGGEFAPHWSFVTPQKSPAPQVKHRDLVRDAIDQYVLARIEQAGLEPNEDAGRAALLRRVTFDLTGLPPTPEELRAFLEDDSPRAYEQVVDRLLESPRYGEHMARYWLDLVRYGDTHGLHLDNYREMWPYRDWVIRAFNANKPFDEFIVEQLAGDLLPGEELDHLVASGFNRLNVTTNEGGSIYDEVFARNVIDRTDAFGTIFLGLTTGCAVCHDHKFDPLSQRDFYALSAFFNSLDGRAMDGNAKAHPPVVRVPTPESERQLAEVEQMRQQLERELDGPLPAVDAAQQRWEETIAGGTDRNPQWIVLKPTSASSTGNSEMTIREDGAVVASGEVPDKETVTIDATLPGGGDPFQLVRLEVLTATPEARAGRSPNGNAVLSEFEVQVKSSATGVEWMPVKLGYAEADYEQGNSPKFTVNYAIDGKVEPAAGWAIGGHERTGPRTAWFVSNALLGGEEQPTQLRVVLKYESQFAGHSFGQVRLSVSQDMPRASADRQLKLGDWHVAGPFEVENYAAGFYREFASQGGAFDAEAEFPFAGETIRWETRADWADAAVEPVPAIADRTSVSVVHRQITVSAPQNVTLLVGATDGFQVWLAGKKLFETRRHGEIEPLRYEVELPLKEGLNDLYIKTVNESSETFLAAALRSPAVPVSDAVRSLAKLPRAERSEAQQATLRRFYRRVLSIHPDWLVLKDMVAGLKKREEEIQNGLPTTLVWRETEQPRTAHILERGQYDKPGEAVSRAVPGALLPMDESLPRDRLGLARWLIDPEHPLTARVAVNRFWQQLFGVGIVETSEDFGAQGRPPSHPELLDALAVDFRESGWDVKGLMKRLVMSSTYRRSSRVVPGMLEIDPKNRLLARGPRFRLDAEMIRDAALQASGVLVHKLGGPGVKPPQPEGLWRAVGYTSSNTAVFKADSGEAIHRRSVYTFWKRTSPPPQMSTFDAPSRESCTARRERTNTPLQALLLLNEPQYMEAAKRLAERAEATGESFEQQVDWMYQAVVSRGPTDTERAELVRLHNDLRKVYADAPDMIESLGVTDADEAAATLVASTILNLDEAITK